MKSSEISAKYSWPTNAQKDEIQDSGVTEEEDILDLCGCNSSKERGSAACLHQGGNEGKLELVDGSIKAVIIPRSAHGDLQICSRNAILSRWLNEPLDGSMEVERKMRRKAQHAINLALSACVASRCF